MASMWHKPVGRGGVTLVWFFRGYGFVKFADESEQKAAIEECQGTMLGGKTLRLSIAVAKRYDATSKHKTESKLRRGM